MVVGTVRAPQRAKACRGPTRGLDEGNDNVRAVLVELRRRVVSGASEAVLIGEVDVIAMRQSPMVVMIATVVMMVMIVAVLVCVDVAREGAHDQIEGHEDDHDSRNRPPQ